MTPGLAALDRAGVHYEIFRYDIATDGPIGLAAAQALGVDPALVYKTLIARLDSSQLVVAIVPVARSLNLKLLSAAAGARHAMLASPEEAQRSSGYVVGGISPFGQKRRLPTFLATEAQALQQIYVSAGRRGVQILLATDDLVRCCAARIFPLCQGDNAEPRTCKPAAD